MSVAHGGRLVDRIASPELAAELRWHAPRLRKLRLTLREINDLGLIANGALSPLRGFMNRADCERVVTEMRLADGLPWTIPVTLAVSKEARPRTGERVALQDPDGNLLAVIEVDDVYPYDKQLELREVYRTQDEAHPGVAAVCGRSEFLVGGSVQVLPTLDSPASLTPRQARAAFAERGWKSVVGFQTRNPIHRAHEYIQKCALEAHDGLFIHPLIGETKSDDVPAEVRMKCYEVLIEHYYPQERVILSTLPAAMRYAGPREAIFHALIRKNYGCTHFIVGRDHAGVGSYYGTYDAQKIFDEFAPDELGIVPLKFENSFYCSRCGSMASRKTCAHAEEHHISLSGSAVRALLREGKLPPPEFSRPEVAKILLSA